MHRLRSSDLADGLSYLELAARRARCGGLAERIAAYPVRRRWSISWTHSPPDHPHRVLAGHHGPVREVVGISAADRAARAASVGDDGILRLWDIASAELLGTQEVNRAGLAAVDLAELPGPRQLAVVLSVGGSLTAHELPSMSRVLDVHVRSGLRGVLQTLQLGAYEMRCVRLPDGRWAAITGGPGLITAIWDIETGALIVRLSAGLRPASLAFRNLASGDPVVVSTDRRPGAERIFAFATGRLFTALAAARVQRLLLLLPRRRNARGRRGRRPQPSGPGSVQGPERGLRPDEPAVAANRDARDRRIDASLAR